MILLSTILVFSLAMLLFKRPWVSRPPYQGPKCWAPEADMIEAGWEWNANLECWEIFV